MNRFFFASLLVGSACTAPCLAQDPRPEGPNPRRPNADRPEGQRPGQGRPGQGRPGQGNPGEGRPGGGFGGGFGGGAANPEMAARGMAMMLRNMPLFKALDADEDGQLSASEIENASKSILKLDKNGDGVVSAEEMRPEPGQMPMFAGPNAPGAPGATGAPGNAGGPNPEMMMRMFENRDKDKDGKLSGDEIPPQMKERLSNIDTNGDGAIDKAEIEQSMKRLEGMRPGNRRPEGRTEGGEGVRPRRPTSDT
ncbi:MAG: hypothetical protein WCP62_00350 [Planctomycetota bacterium]